MWARLETGDATEEAHDGPLLLGGHDPCQYGIVSAVGVDGFSVLRALAAVSDRRRAAKDICSGVADFRIAYVDTLPDTVEGVPLRSEPLQVVLPAWYVLAAQKPAITLGDLESWPLVSPQRETYTRWLVAGVATQAGFSLRHAVTMPRFLDIFS